MLSSVLRSAQAVRVNIEIMRAFVRLRASWPSTASLARRLDELEGRYDSHSKVVFDAIRGLMKPPEVPRRPAHRLTRATGVLGDRPRTTVADAACVRLGRKQADPGGPSPE